MNIEWIYGNAWMERKQKQRKRRNFVNQIHDDIWLIIKPTLLFDLLFITWKNQYIGLSIKGEMGDKVTKCFESVKLKYYTYVKQTNSDPFCQNLWVIFAFCINWCQLTQLERAIHEAPPTLTLHNFSTYPCRNKTGH